MMKTTLFTFSLICLICLSTVGIAQDSFRGKFNEANKRMDESLFKQALPLWLDIYKQDSTNANINYKIGVCYMHAAKAENKKEALPYLVRAIKNTTANYDVFSAGEKHAPIETEFYLAKAYHLDNQFDSAKKYYDAFLKVVTKKHHLYKAAVHDTAAVRFAAYAIKHPVKIKVENLGPVINSKYPDYSPVISVDESTIYYTSRRLRTDSSNYGMLDPNDGKYFEDIYESNKIDGQWSTPKLIKNINTQGHEATLNISADGQTLYIYKDDNGDGNIYVSKFDGTQWGKPEKLNPNIDGTSYETHAAVTPDGKQLYFVSNREGGFGGKDIWFCNKLPNGKWALPQNAGPVINTKYNEDGVFIHPDNKTMYFSSEGHLGMGGYDIFYSKRGKDGKWQKPINMGYPINSVGDDVFFVVSADGRRGYYSSAKPGGYGDEDIYMLQLIDAKATQLTLLVGTISVKGQDTLPDDALVTVTNEKTGNLVGKYRPRKKDGKFTIIIPPGSDYHLVYSAGGYTAGDDIFVPVQSTYQQINKAIVLKPISFGSNNNAVASNNNSENSNADNSNKENATNANQTNQTKQNNNSNKPTYKNTAKKVNRSDVHFQKFFGYNNKKVSVKDHHFNKFIKNVVAYIKQNGKISLTIEASASKVPTKTFVTNKNLSEKRALEAKLALYAALKKEGITKSQIEVNIKTLVQGPDYTHDPNNRKKYRPYQYTKIY